MPKNRWVFHGKILDTPMFIEKDNECNTLSEKRDQIINELSKSMDNYKSNYDNFANKVNGYNISEEGLEFSIEVPFRKDAFIEKMMTVFFNRNAKFKELVPEDDFQESHYNSAFMTQIITNTLDEGLPLKKGATVESAIRDVVGDWYNTVYRVTMDGDTIGEMSPGKKALVLLEILISLAESNCPILIDQPEDDLDNRSIYDDLIKFIKKKKKERQIIVVTHNANIVLGGDADEVIIANQMGSTSQNKEHRFEYRSGAIENAAFECKDDGTPEDGILNQNTIQDHICDILEGGISAFEIRKNKYHI